jgi:tripartite-type tricarboxylate transporter receptor subunit TctC
MSFRSVFGALLVASATALSHAANAADTCDGMFEGARFTLIVPYKAGGGFDLYARAFAPLFEKATGASMIVSNVSSAGGLTGIASIANADAEDNTLGFFGSSKILGVGEQSVPPSQLQPLASVGIDLMSWIAKKDAKLGDFIGKDIVGAATARSVMLTRQQLVAKTLGSRVHTVAGYGGSVDTTAAVLRGEVDFTSRTVQAGSISRKDDDIDFLLIISDKPVRGMEDIPYLAGAGGLVEQINADKPAAVREEAMRLAQLAVELNARIRAFFVTSKLQGARRDCLAAATEAVVFDKDFSRTMNGTGRTVEPMNFAETTAYMTQLTAAFAQSTDLLEELRLEAKN